MSVGQQAVDAGQRAYDVGLDISRNAIWADDPVTQIGTNLVILVAAMLSSAVTWLIGLFIAGVALVLLTVGVLRFLYQLWQEM